MSITRNLISDLTVNVDPDELEVTSFKWECGDIEVEFDGFEDMTPSQISHYGETIDDDEYTVVRCDELDELEETANKDEGFTLEEMERALSLVMVNIIVLTKGNEPQIINSSTELALRIGSVMKHIRSES